MKNGTERVSLCVKKVSIVSDYIAWWKWPEKAVGLLFLIG
jgi:hypothetical protein